MTQAPETPRRRMGTPEKVSLAGLVVALVVVLVNYMLGGLDGLGYAWFNLEQATVEFVSWRISVYVLAIVPLIAVAGWLSRHCLPTVTMCMRGASNEEAAFVTKWYWPGSYRVEEGEVSWREGKYRVFVNKDLVGRLGLFLGRGIKGAVERNVDEATREVTYDPIEVPAYRSRTLHRRLQLERRAMTRLEERLEEK